MATENSETFLSSIIKKSQLIQSGSPKIYQLNAVTKITEGLKTVTVGTKKVNRLNRTILLLGETGTGKSALINVLVNYAMGVKWGDEVWFKIVEETTSQSESQTSDVIMYQIFGFEGKRLPFSLTLVDTPGYRHTGGTERDAFIGERLLEWFTSDCGVQEVHAVGLVLKASDNRLSDRLGYVFNSVASLFGANMEENIFALLTHSGGVPPDNALTALADAQIKYAKDEQGQPVHFVFDNCQSDQRKSDQRMGQCMRNLKNAWEDSEDQMKQFMEVLNVTEAQTLWTTVEVIKQRNQLKECIINLQDKLKFIELKKTQIDQEKALHIKCEEKMKANEKYEEDVDEPYKERVPIEGGRWWFYWVKGATSCLLCEETCHRKCECTLRNGRYCPIFDGRDRCTVCTNKCERKHHVKKKWIYVPKTRKVRKTHEDIKKEYKEGVKGMEKHSSTLEQMQQEMEKLLEQEHEGLEKSFQHITRLESIALNIDSIFTFKHLDFLIERMQDEKFAEEVRKLKEMKQRTEGKNLRKALDYAATAGGDKKKQK